MLRTLNGVVSGFLLLVMLGIGTTPAEAVSASKQHGINKPGQSILCEKADILCSIGNISTATLTPKKLVVNESGVLPTPKLASPVESLDPAINAAPVLNTDVCSMNSAPTPSVTLEPTKTMPLVSSVSYYATPTSTLDQPITIGQTTPTPTPIETVTPTPPVSTTHPLDAEKLFGLVNQKRTEAGLPALVKDPQVCAISAARAPEMESDVASGNMHHGFYSRKPAYSSTENMIYMRTEEEALNWWLNSPVHRAAIYGNYRQSCVVCMNNTCSEIFANLPDTSAPTQ